MRDEFFRPVRSATNSILCTGIAWMVLTVMLSSCSADLPAQRESQRVLAGFPASPYSIVFVIHGDGDYLYHDTSGTECTADEEALAEAKRIAERNPRAEVFIFHQIPRKHFLYFFPLHDGEFYYYRNGRLIANELYWRDQQQSHFDPEARLYRSIHGNEKSATARLFIYCGHEIPEFGGAGYDASYPDRTFTVDDMADGLKTFTRDSTEFDLMILSTCFGGTPYTISALGPFARYIVASPDNLHLSYFDLHPLERLDIGLRDGDVPAFARRFAHQSFDRLTRDIQTAVSVAVYDVDRVQEFLHSVQGVYDHTLTTLKGEDKASTAMVERCDCTDIPAYVLATIHQGVEILYRPAHFGRSRLKQGHSGWECWRESAPQAAPSQTTESVLK
jgi:hypothetical protein